MYRLFTPIGATLSFLKNTPLCPLLACLYSSVAMESMCIVCL